jgi:hypothetical protein
LSSYYAFCDESTSGDGLTNVAVWQLNKFHEFYSKLQSNRDLHRQLQILEFGGGPTIYSLISASPYAEGIVFTDYVGRNRAVVESWKNKEVHAPNYRPLIEYVVTTIEGQGMEEVEQRRQLLRDKIVAIVPCDVRGDPPIGVPAGPEKYDVLSTHYCLVTACESVEMYRDSLRKLASFVRPGGYILASEIVGGTFYMVGDVKFSNITLSRDVIRQALVDAGFSRDIRFFSLPVERSATEDGTEYLVISARKCDESD